MMDTLAVLVLFGCAVACSAAVLLWHYVLGPALKALWARLKAGDDPFRDAAYGDVVFVPADALKTVFHDNRIIEGGQPNNGA